MTLVAPNVGEATMLSCIVNKAQPQDLVLKLFTNNVAPGETDTAITYVEASGYGYSPITLTGANWTITPGDPSIASYPQVTFTFTGPLGSVYGYYVVQSTSGTVMWAEAFDGGPFPVRNPGDNLRIAPALSLS